MKNGTTKSPAVHKSNRLDANLRLGQRASALQKYGTVTNIPIGLDAKVRKTNADMLNQILADTITLRDLYKKHHWQVSGMTFYQLHLLFDKHADELTDLVDSIAERVQMLGGVAIAMAADVAEMTKIQRPPRDREEVPVQIDRLLKAHEILLIEARKGAEQADDNGDLGTNDLLSSKLVPTTEMQVWFVGEHVVDGPTVIAE